MRRLHLPTVWSRCFFCAGWLAQTSGVEGGLGLFWVGLPKHEAGRLVNQACELWDVVGSGMASNDHQTLTVITLQEVGHMQEAFALDLSFVIVQA